MATGIGNRREFWVLLFFFFLHWKKEEGRKKKQRNTNTSELRRKNSLFQNWTQRSSLYVLLWGPKSSSSSPTAWICTFRPFFHSRTPTPSRVNSNSRAGFSCTEKRFLFSSQLEYPFADFGFFRFTNSNFAQLSGDICRVVEGREGSRLALLWFFRIGFFVCFQSQNCLTSCELSSLFQFLHVFLIIIVIINSGEEGGLFLLGCVWWYLFSPVFCSTILSEKFF